MKTQLISLALFTMISSQAYGHKIYSEDCDDSAETAAKYEDFESEEFKLNLDSIPGEPTGILGQSGVRKTADADKCYSASPEAKALRAANPGAPESDRVAAMNFCKIGGYENPVDCASDILDKGLADASRACMEKLQSYINDPAINPVASKLGGASTVSGGVFHFDYCESMEDGVPRHAYSDVQRDLAGRPLATSHVDMEKRKREVDSRSESHSSNSSGSAGVNGSVTVGVPVSGPSVTLGAEAGVSGGSEHGTTTQKGPMTQKEIDTQWKKWYEIGKADPQKAGFEPDILCYRNEKDCLTSSGEKVRNTSYQPDAPAKKEESSNKSESSSKPAYKGSENDNSHRNPSSSDPSPSDGGGTITSSHGGSWAGEPSKSGDGSVWADFGQEVPDNDPMAQCIFDAHKEKVKDSANKSWDTGGGADTRSDAQKKRDAESLLKKGICDEKYFGRDYCANWKKKREMIDSAPDVLDEQKPILTPGKQSERPGYLHFDPEKAPLVVPDLGPNYGPGASGGGNTKIPKLK